MYRVNKKQLKAIAQKYQLDLIVVFGSQINQQLKQLSEYIDELEGYLQITLNVRRYVG